MVDVAGGHAADVRLDLLAVDTGEAILRLCSIAAVADGSTGTVGAIALAGDRRHLSGSAHGDIAAAARGTAADASTIVAAGGRQAAGFFIIVLLIVLQGQRAFRGVFSRPAL